MSLESKGDAHGFARAGSGRSSAEADLAASRAGRARAGGNEPPTTDQIRRVLRECHGNRTQAARTLGMARSSFYRLLDERGLTGVRPAAGINETIGEA